MGTNKQNIYLVTAESVTEGHPDKVADQISDAVLDACLEQDPMSRVACETLVTKDNVVLAGEITTQAVVDYEAVARKTIRRIGYDRPVLGFSADTCRVQVMIHEQASDIDLGVRTGGAGDQGLMFGFACNETPELMPLPISQAHRLTRQLAKVRKEGTIPWLMPDGKAQVTIEYRKKKPSRIHTVVLSAQHEEGIAMSQLREILDCEVIKAALPAQLLDQETRILINPTGRFVHGGPAADTGLTGRKIIVDTYGGAVPHGGGAFSGKDATKVDRSGAYMARHIAKSIVASGLSDKALVKLAYAIGEVDPVAVRVDTFGVGNNDWERDLENLVRERFRLTPEGIMETLGLREPIFGPTAVYGHFGREDAGFFWEKTTDLSNANITEKGRRFERQLAGA